MTQSSDKIKKPLFLYNPGQKPVYIRDLDIKVKQGETVDVFSYHKDIQYSGVLLSSQTGSLRDVLSSGSLIIVESRAPLIAAPKIIESKVPIRRRQLIAPLPKDKSSNFIERLQQDFTDKISSKSEHDIAKNTEELINSFDFDGFADPLE